MSSLIVYSVASNSMVPMSGGGNTFNCKVVEDEHPPASAVSR